MGWTIERDNKEGQVFIALMILLLIIDFVLVLARQYARTTQSYHSLLSDYVLWFAMAMTIGLVVTMYDTYTHGFGMTTAHYTMGDLEESWRTKLFAPTIILWNAATTAVRVSMVIFYRQIFAPSSDSATSRWS
ncbi:hypothetical protein BO70DRAFT_394734 [Aspergillus heteromorphus CBS 117.55]|uniref:Rhodopsin domain-containing protein n=1 Tax=Aspergillus heteromorphus CBS 117.55 TaxID=1448321 RepID=A0A317WJU3_9EURO|nr:uncharacterized protein BO70DRAFT_394734 [Aspergillus heteromorphus CBS 117.55]PWY86716.1 hypothetical protein BO70DRAFT_394734 [Aspergillus heteromorphus CBS 117.55]